MDPEQFNNLDDLLNAAEDEQKALLHLNNNLRKVITDTISEKFPELTSPDSEKIEKIKIIAAKASKSITHDVYDLFNKRKDIA